MANRNVSRLDKNGAPSWVRGLGVAALVFFLMGNLILIGFSWAYRGGVGSYATLAFLGILALLALTVLARAWKSFTSPRRQVE
jgi:hypothetical protein